MGIDWEKTQPNPPLDDFSKSLVREIAEHFLKTGTGVPDHAKRVELGKHRHLLNSLVQRGFLSNIGNKFYPAFAALYYLPPEPRARCEEATAWVLRAFQALYKAGAGQTFSLAQISDQINRMWSLKLLSSELIGAETARLGMLFTRDFNNYFGSNFEYGQDIPVKQATVSDNILDFEDLQQAWQEEVARRNPPPTIVSPTRQPERLGDAEKSKDSTDKLRRVFVVHGRDEKLRSGAFTFLRSLGLDPLEWTKAIQLTGNASPYIGQILDAAFAYAQAVVVLLTPDDLAKLREDLLVPDDPIHESTVTGQARPNVLFEAGMAFASHPNQTVLVQFGQVRPFSDVAGRHIVKMDNSASKRQEFALKLRTAGCAVDTDGTDWHTSGDLTPPTQNTENSRSQASNEAIRPPGPNLVLIPGIRMGTLYLRHDHWSETAPQGWDRPESHKAIWAEIKNKSDSRPIGSVSDVRAELIIGDDEFSPLSWIDNEFNLVKFDFGASQFVVLTVEVPGGMHGDWRIPISRKDYDYPPGLRALYLDNFVKVTMKDAPIRLNLLHVSAGKVLKSLRGLATWRQNMPWFVFH